MGKAGEVRWHTFLSLFHFDGEIERSNGEVNSLGIHLPHCTQQVDDVGTLIPNQTHQQLRNPVTKRQHR